MPYIVDRDNIVIVNQNSKYNSKPLPYKMNDLDRVFVHYDRIKGYNIPTENKLNRGVANDAEN